MLKLEKLSKNREVTIRLQGKGKLLNRTFIQALALAAAIHGFGFLFFHVQPFKISHVETIFPPVAVNTDLGLLGDGTVLTNLEDLRGASSPLLYIKPSRPTLPKIPKGALNKHFLFERISPKQIDPFPTETLLPWEESSTATKELEIVISGDLSSRKILHSQRTEASTPYAKYLVKVDNRLGKIVWYHLENGEQSDQAKKMLSTLRFEREREGFLSEGYVEFIQ